MVLVVAVVLVVVIDCQRAVSEAGKKKLISPCLFYAVFVWQDNMKGEGYCNKAWFIGGEGFQRKGVFGRGEKQQEGGKTVIDVKAEIAIS